MKRKTSSEEIVRLPFGIEIARDGHGVTAITSNLREHLSGDTIDPAADIAADVIESMILSLSANGCDIESIEFSAAIEDAVEAIGDHMDDLDKHLCAPKMR